MEYLYVMKKNILNEQISRIKSMMGKINESEYEMESLSNMSMSEDDDNMGSNNLIISHSGCFPHNWIVDVNFEGDDEDSVTVHVKTWGIDNIKVYCDEVDNLHSTITNNQAIRFVKQKIEDGTLVFPPFITMDGDEFHS
jgi:prefoldin subunit 5